MLKPEKMAEPRVISLSTTVPLNDGNRIPTLGLGVFLSKNDGEAEQACLWALQHGYRHIDTAKFYANEEDVGKAVRNCGIPREEIFVTTKVWNTDHGKENTIQACKESLKKLGLSYIDLYLMHSPLSGKVVETWDAMIQLKEQGLVKSIGVSNFNIHHLEGLKKERPDHIPAVNQIELHPYLNREAVVSHCEKEGIVVESYSPLTKGMKLGDPKLVAIADKYKKTTAQILIRWCLEKNFVVIPKSSNKERIIQNASVFDFKISPEDMQALRDLNEDLIVSWDPLSAPWEP